MKFATLVVYPYGDVLTVNAERVDMLIDRREEMQGTRGTRGVTDVTMAGRPPISFFGTKDEVIAELNGKDRLYHEKYVALAKAGQLSGVVTHPSQQTVKRGHMAPDGRIIQA